MDGFLGMYVVGIVGFKDCFALVWRFVMSMSDGARKENASYQGSC